MLGLESIYTIYRIIGAVQSYHCQYHCLSDVTMLHWWLGPCCYDWRILPFCKNSCNFQANWIFFIEAIIFKITRKLRSSSKLIICILFIGFLIFLPLLNRMLSPFVSKSFPFHFPQSLTCFQFLFSLYNRLQDTVIFLRRKDTLAMKERQPLRRNVYRQDKSTNFGHGRPGGEWG